MTVAAGEMQMGVGRDTLLRYLSGRLEGAFRLLSHLANVRTLALYVPRAHTQVPVCTGQSQQLQAHRTQSACVG